MMRHSLHLLGAPALLGPDGAPVTGRAAHRHRVALLALLATAPRLTVSRDKLMAYLWPEADERRARHLLNVAVHVIRKSLGESVLISEGDDLRLDADALSVDVVRFVAAAERGELEEAVAAYGGAFLDGFHLNGSTEFEKWLDGERASLEELHQSSLERLAAAAERRADWAVAVAWRRRLAAAAPYTTRHVLALMEVLERAGDRGEALRLAAEHEALLRDELGAEPDPALLDLVRRLRESPHGDWRPERVGPPPEVGAPAAPAEPVEPRAHDGVSDETARLSETVSSSPDPAGPVAERGRRPKRSLTIAGAAAALLLAVGVLGPFTGSSRPTATDPPVERSPAVLVLPFSNETGDPELDPIGRMGADLIIQGISETALAPVVSLPGALELIRMVREADDSAERPAGATPGLPVRRLADLARATVIVSGTYYRADADIFFRVEVFDAETGRVLGPLPVVTAPFETPVEGLEVLRRRVTGLLAARFDPRGTEHALSLDRAPLYEAYLEYMASLEVDPQREKLSHLLRASALDSTFIPPLLDAVGATRGLASVVGVDTALALRDSLLEVADRRADLFTPVQRYRLEVLEAIFRGDRLGRYEAARKMATVSPDHRFALATPAFTLGRYREAIELMLSSPYAQGRPNRTWWKMVGAGYHFLGEHEAELAHAQRGRVQHPGRLIFYEMETTALAALGRVDEVFDVIDEGLAIAGGDEGFPFELFFLATGQELMWHGHEAAAREVFGRAMEEMRRRERDEEPRHFSFALAEAFGFLEQWDEVRALAELSLSVDPVIYHARWLGYLGLAAARTGDREEALLKLRELEALEGNPARIGAFGDAAMERAKIAAALGDCEEAVRHLLDGFDRGLGHQYIHRRLGLHYCREDPTFLRVAAPTG